MRLIDADELLKDGFKFRESYRIGATIFVPLREVRRSVEDAPTVNVKSNPIVNVTRRKVGRWIEECYIAFDGEVKAVYRCSRCGEYLHNAKEYNYCPKCGSRMIEIEKS